MNDSESSTAAVAEQAPHWTFSVLHAAHLIEDRMELALSKVSLSMAKHGALTQLVMAGEPLTLSQLATRLSCVRSNMTQLMDRLEKRVGFHVHAHAFRHTFATVTCQAGWNLERLRAAMGHADYGVLHRYIRLSTERGLGQEREWEDFILANAAIGPGIGRQR